MVIFFDSQNKIGKFLDEGRNFLNKAFRLSDKSLIKEESDGQQLIKSLEEIMGTLAMVDYPYPAKFLSDLPGWPVKVACKTFTREAESSDYTNANNAVNIVQVFYNSSGQATENFCLIGSCPGPFDTLGDALGWPWQVKNE